MGQILTIYFILIILVVIPTSSQQLTPLSMTIPWSDNIKVCRVLPHCIRNYIMCNLQSNNYQCTGAPVPHNATYTGEYDVPLY